jgi:hypothetical protein
MLLHHKRQVCPLRISETKREKQLNLAPVVLGDGRLVAASHALPRIVDGPLQKGLEHEVIHGPVRFRKPILIFLDNVLNIHPEFLTSVQHQRGGVIEVVGLVGQFGELIQLPAPLAIPPLEIPGLSRLPAVGFKGGIDGFLARRDESGVEAGILPILRQRDLVLLGNTTIRIPDIVKQDRNRMLIRSVVVFPILSLRFLFRKLRKAVVYSWDVGKKTRSANLIGAV